jgi:LemA protein
VIVLLIVLAILVILGIYLVVTYNGLIRSRNGIDNSWAQIDVQLKRRIDLIPNLIETVKGYAAHERQTLEAVISCSRCPRPTPISRPTRTSSPCRRS